MGNRSPVRHHKTPAERADIVAEYPRSQVSQREFAAQHGIALSTLQRWLHLNESDVGSGSPALVEVPNPLKPLLGRGPAATYRLHFPRGLVLEVAPGFQTGEVRALAQLLQEL